MGCCCLPRYRYDQKRVMQRTPTSNHKFTLQYDRGVLYYLSRVINRWFVRNAQNYHRGVESCGGCDFLCTGDILCQLQYTPSNRGAMFFFFWLFPALCIECRHSICGACTYRDTMLVRFVQKSSLASVGKGTHARTNRRSSNNAGRRQTAGWKRHRRVTASA